MKRLFLILYTLLLCGSFASCQPHYTPEEKQLRKDIAEMLMVGFRGTEIDDDNTIVRDICDYGVGGVILFEFDCPSQSRPRNITSPQQLRQLCASLQGLGTERLFIAIDQEGGMVNRLKPSYGFPSFPSPAATAAQGNDSVRHCAALTAQWLNWLGINLNFAPCVDVNVNPECPVIGRMERSFSDNPERVAECASIWIEEQQRRGVLSCLKHFPGHGSSKADTHAGLVDVSDTWLPLELEPYRTLIGKKEVQMIMTTHVFNSHLDSIYPATLSTATLTTLLRDSLHFEGVIVTDDLAMGAMVRQYSFDDILLRTILAGADMLCLSNNGGTYDPDLVPHAVDAIFQMVKEGKISAARITQSANKIRNLKKEL